MVVSFNLVERRFTAGARCAGSAGVPASVHPWPARVRRLVRDATSPDMPLLTVGESQGKSRLSENTRIAVIKCVETLSQVIDSGPVSGPETQRSAQSGRLA